MTSSSATHKTIRSNLIKTAFKKIDDDKSLNMINFKITIDMTVNDENVEISKNDENVEISAKIKKSALFKDENVMILNSLISTMITHHSIYQIYNTSASQSKSIIVLTNNIKMNLFALYSLYDIYMNCDFNKIELKYLSSAETILFDYWVWKILNVKIADFKEWNVDFVKRDLQVNRILVNRLVVTFAHTTKTWHYIVMYENIKLHEDDERRLKWSQILNWKLEKKFMIFIECSAIQVYVNKISFSVNLLRIELIHWDLISISFMWSEIYTLDDQKFFSVSSSASINASIEMMIVTDDSASKRRIAMFNSSSKKIKITSEKKIKNDKYLVISFSENEQILENEIWYVSLSKFNELYENVESFQRMSYILLRELKNEIVNVTTYNETITEMYENNWILHQSLIKNMTTLNDVKIIVQDHKKNIEWSFIFFSQLQHWYSIYFIYYFVFYTTRMLFFFFKTKELLWILFENTFELTFKLIHDLFLF